MKVSELRIGNYLQGKSVVEVDGVIAGEFVSIKSNNSIFIVEGDNPCLKPILLTEEWFVKFGFKKWFKLGTDGWDFYIDILRIAYFGEFFHLWYKDHPITEIKYVHQLQNLYFALTQTELVLNEKK